MTLPSLCITTHPVSNLKLVLTSASWWYRVHITDNNGGQRDE
nr:MAG TPA: hypothetical protein [Caudoviricetes sp.]